MATTQQQSQYNTPIISPLSILRMVWKQWILLLVTWVSLACVGLYVVRQLPTLYSAEAVILVESQKIPETLVASTVNAEVQDRLATIRQQILSSSRLQKIIDKYALYSKEKLTATREDLIEMMRKDIAITLERGWTRNQPGAFRIKYTAPSAETAASVANELSNLFLEENARTRENQAAGTSEFLEGQLQQAKKNLEELEAKVSAYKQAHNGELPEQEQSLLAMIDHLKVQLQGQQDAISRAEQTKTILEQEVASAEAYQTAMNRILTENPTAPINSSGTVVSRNGSLAADTRRSDALKKELSDLMLRYTADFPLVKETKSLLAQTLKQEEEEQKKIRELARAIDDDAKKLPSPPGSPPKVASSVRPELAQVLLREQARVNSLKTQLQIAVKEIEKKQADRDEILKAIADYQVRLEKLPIRQQEMASLLRDYDISRDNYKSLLSKDFSAEMSSDMEKRQKAERFTILDPARVPERPSKPNRLVLNSAAVSLSLVFGLILAIGQEWRQGLLLGDWELPSGTIVLGYIPAIQADESIRRPRRSEPARNSARGLRWGLISSLVLSIAGLIALGLWLRRG